MVVGLKINFKVAWKIWKSCINTFGMSIAGVWHVDSWGAVETVVIACAHFSQKKIVQNMRSLNSVFSTESSEQGTINGIIVRVNCEASVFIGDAGWIARNTIEFIFNFQNINIFQNIIFSLLSDQETNRLILARLFVFQPGGKISWGFVPIDTLSS